VTVQDAAAAQIVIAVSTVIACVGRCDNIVRELWRFGLPDLVRSLVGATKISPATRLVAGIWCPVPVAGPALVMAALMRGAQGAHASVGNPCYKFVPSFVLLVLSFLAAGVHAGHPQ
jgi:DoxX-like family